MDSTKRARRHGYRLWFTRHVASELLEYSSRTYARVVAVVLDCHPIFTTMIILAGWAVKTALAHLVSGWVGASINFGVGSEGAERVAEEMWLAYSIP